jgi:hypothetical protein
MSALTSTWQTFFSLDRPGKIVCVGLNYHDHADESGMEIPAQPLLFGKFPNTPVGPGEPIVLPPTSAHVDAEAELAVVIGATARSVGRDHAMDPSSGSRSPTTSARATCSSATASGSAARASTPSAPSSRRSCRAPSRSSRAS